MNEFTPLFVRHYYADFNIETDIKKIMNTYNNLVHKNTKHTPNEVFYSQSQELFNEVKLNCIERFKFLQNLECNFMVNENCLLKNNFILLKQKDKFGHYYLIKNKIKKNKSFYKLCGKIVNVWEMVIILLKFYQTIKIIDYLKEINLMFPSIY